MPTMSYESMAKYLGVRLDPEGAIKLPEEQWKEWFNNVNTAPLKPEQKIIAIKTCIVPRMIFQLRVADAGIAKLGKINTMIKIWFKKVLHLPEWTPDCWIHLKAGGELTNIIESILKMRKKASEKMVNSADSGARGFKEIFVIIAAVHTWSDQGAHMQITFMTDNSPIFDIWYKGSTSDPDIMCLQSWTEIMIKM